MVSGGLGATDGGSSDARANTGTRAFGGPPSEAGKNLHLSTQSKAYAPRHIHPARIVGRSRIPAGAISATSNSIASALDGTAAADAEGRVDRERWVGRYQAALITIDLVAAFTAVVAAYLIRFGYPGEGANPGLYLAVAAGLPLAWVSVVAFNRAYEGRFVGAGTAEFERIFRAFLHLTALVAFVSFATGADLSRGFIVLALPFALTVDLVGRYAARKYLHAKRSAGRAMRSVLAVGDPDAIASFAAMLRRDQYAGMHVVGGCVPGEMSDEIAGQLDDIGVPLLGDVDAILDSAQFIGADTVAVISSSLIGPERLRWISWQLEHTDVQLVVSPGLIEVAGPRLHIQPVAGLPLLHVEQPQFGGFRRFVKGAFDRTVAGLTLIVLSPILLGITLGVRLTSRGPALFRQTRVGRDGQSFTMVKFRSMYLDAEDRLAELRDRNHNADGLLFKMRDDPRVTRIGRFLRKFSLDELPQLINIVTGSMSLVGPRPPLPTEVAKYGDDVRRRLLVKPGLTGLWQVSGRSDLSWEESVRLDLRYVENWSPALDLMILWKTAFAVLGRSGAY
jgi:exopolysaccharide biosynthesis polyprenyl glycosylphosphotransferase